MNTVTWNYDRIKSLAAERGARVADLLALAPQNDPFYTGRPAELDAAQWFYTLYQRFNYNGGVHLRRIHYQIVSQTPPVAMPNGDPYQNTQNCWDFLNNAAKWARYLDLVPSDQFVDRRNPDAHINSRFSRPGDWFYDDPTPNFEVAAPESFNGYTVPDLPDLPDLPYGLPSLPDLVATGYAGIQQSYLVEIWAEKTTMNDVLLPLCQMYGVNLVTGAGELSITAVIAFLKRVESSGKPARILYISDFDPAGLGMPISVARKIEFYLRQLEDAAPDVKLDPIVLTPEQIAEFKLPRVPVKDGDKRKENFEAAYGQGQVELDALEALHPGVLRRIVREAILNYYDPALSRDAAATRASLQNHLSDLRHDVEGNHSYDLFALREGYQSLVADYAQTQAGFAAMIARFQPQLDAYKERLAGFREQGAQVYENVYQELIATDVDLENYELPQPDLPAEPGAQLYESARGYMEQLSHYQAHRNNAAQLPLEEIA